MFPLQTLKLNCFPCLSTPLDFALSVFEGLLVIISIKVKFEVVSWWKHKHRFSVRECLSLLFSFIGKWNSTSNNFKADISQNSIDNISLGSNLRKDCHSLANLKLYGPTYGTLILWYCVSPCVMTSSPELMSVTDWAFFDFCCVGGLAVIPVSF